MSHTARIGAFVHGLRAGDLPPEVRRLAALVILDLLGCAFGGARTVMAERAMAALAPVDGTGPSTAMGLGLRLRPQEAAFLGAHCANMLDFDDTFLDLGHPGTTVVPAALAVAEAGPQGGHAPRQAPPTGDDLLAAVAAGYEISCRLAEATRPSLERFREIYPVPWHSVGAAVAAARLYGLDEAGIRQAIGACLELAPCGTVLTTEVTYGFKAGKFGHFAASGVLAAALVRAGFAGKQHALDPETPFWLAYGTDTCDYDLLTRGLGDTWLMTQLSFKPYPSCRMAQSAIDAARSQAVDPAEVESVELGTFTRALQLSTPVPSRFEEGPFCLPYVVALGLARVPPGPDWYSPERMADPDLGRLARMVRLTALPEFDARNRRGLMPARLTVTLRSGEVRRAEVDDARGDPANPLEEDELRAKFRVLADPVLGTAVAVALEAEVLGDQGAGTPGSLRPARIGELLRTAHRAHQKG